ncbi:hypothetical protein THAOC_04041 [Thalassiosira oceanica]|uniref:Uncharacterized protein n=1 Tax=Thalassiosira oceanica TaxID=159749 RepID=K0T697_THAOC|nr:hypothetical protein THAOC_04041 [Thalassiosira oceanica]|eukprot:EJK74293.1 hypothetical protein THAOC_04041 [Thalassiosira oceanica]
MFVWLQALLFAIRHTNGSANEFVNINGGALEACSSEGMALTGWTRNGSCIDENDDTVSARQKLSGFPGAPLMSPRSPSRASLHLVGGLLIRDLITFVSIWAVSQAGKVSHLSLDYRQTPNDLTQTNARHSGENFCTVTGQSGKFRRCLKSWPPQLTRNSQDWCSSSMTCHEDVTQQCPVQNWCVCQWAFASYIEKAGGCSAIQDIQCNAINAQALAAYEADPDRYGHALECLYERCILSEG